MHLLSFVEDNISVTNTNTILLPNMSHLILCHKDCFIVMTIFCRLLRTNFCSSRKFSHLPIKNQKEILLVIITNCGHVATSQGFRQHQL